MSEHETVEIEPFDIAEVTERLMLPAELVTGYIEKFLSEYENADTHLADLLAEKNTAAAAEYVHSVKGISATLGATTLSAYAAELEQSLRQEDVSAIPRLQSRFASALQQTIAQMQGKASS